MKSENTLVTILINSQIHVLNIAKSLLANEGITSYIFDQNVNVTIGTAFVEGYKLKVNSCDIEKAKAILKTLTEEE